MGTLKHHLPDYLFAVSGYLIVHVGHRIPHPNLPRLTINRGGNAPPFGCHLSDF
jgi:hypothetical protein